MHHIISKLIVIVLITQVLFVAGCSGFGTFNSALKSEPNQITQTSSALLEANEALAIQQLEDSLDLAKRDKHRNATEFTDEFSTTPGAKAKKWISHTIKKGQSLVGILTLYGVTTKESNSLVKSSDIAKRLQTIQADKVLRLLLSETKELLELEYKDKQTETIKISKTDSGFISNLVSADVTREESYVHGKIHNSLFADAKTAGLSDALIMKLANIFAWDIDFALHIHNGDTFSVLFEELSIDGKQIGTGDILAAEFINHGKVYRAVRYKDKTGHINYYSPEGNGLRQAFLRTPVKFTRISSRFSLGRKHPILNRIRAHKGVDYAASRGTPVRATGTGKIVHRGRKGGYGKVVILKHGSKYSSLYAHLSNYRKGQRIGSSVKQGDIIGYVGSTGLATGPHLHYEFRVAGVHKNPLTVKLPISISIPKQEMLAFKTKTNPLFAELDKQTNIMLASTSLEK